MRRLTVALSVAALVLVALGGTPLGHAAAQLLPGRSVGTTQLANNAVTGAKVKNGTILAADLKSGSLKAGPAGDAGPAGAAGAMGPAGAAGAAGPLGIVGYTTTSASFPSTGIIRSATVSCPAGYLLTSLGAFLTDSVPADRIGWPQHVSAADGINGFVTAYQYFVGSGTWSGGVTTTCVKLG